VPGVKQQLVRGPRVTRPGDRAGAEVAQEPFGLRFGVDVILLRSLSIPARDEPSTIQ
jgi:hypothetical protein